MEGGRGQGAMHDGTLKIHDLVGGGLETGFVFLKDLSLLQ